MSRDRSRSRAADAQAGEAAARPPLAGGLVGYRLLRRIASGDRADVYLAAADLLEPGGLPDAAAFAPPAGEAVISDGTAPPLVAVRVYPADVSSESVALEIEAMSTDAGGTLPALYDVAGLDDGRCCLAVERISGVAVSRLLTERTLRAGEAVTILAPIAVAVADLAARGFVHTRLAAADILLDDAGRPRLVGLGALRRMPGDEGGAEHTALLRTAHVALTELLEDVAATVRPAGVFDDAIDLMRRRLESRPFRRCETDLERALFAAAAPEPIAGVEVRARSARLPARIGAPLATPAPRPSDDSEPARQATTLRAGGIRGLIGLAQLPEDLGARLAGAADLVPGARVRARVGSAIRSRRRALTVGSLVGGGALVLMLTLVPPATATDAGDPDASATSADLGTPPGETGEDASARPAEASPHSGAEDGASSPEIVGDDPAAAARVLLERRAACFETLDLGCLDEVLQLGSAIESEDRAALLAARDGAEAGGVVFDLSAVQVTAEMGDAVLIGLTRATPEREPASLLLVRGEAGWRLREIFD